MLRKILKPERGIYALMGAICCGILAVDIGRVLGLTEYRGAMTYVRIALIALCAALFLLAAGCMIAGLRKRERATAVRGEKREWTIYAAVILLITAGLWINYRTVNLAYPLVYDGGDEIGVYALIKSILQNGTSLVTPLEGGKAGADMFDYLYSDKLSFLLVKGIGIFVKNPYTVATLFFFLNHYLIALAGTWVCRKIRIGRPMSITVGVLYAFSPYIQTRFCHLWLTPYFMLPLACLAAIWIIEGKVFEEGKRLRDSRTFRKMAVMCFGCAFTGLYYAYFACAMIAAAMVIRCFAEKERKMSRILYPAILIGIIGAAVAVNMIPNLMYWKLYGMNPASEIAMRNGADAEVYGLKMTRMLLPRNFHRITPLWNFTNLYLNNYPLTNENSTAALGLIGSIGFVMSLIMLLSGRKEYRTVSSLNMSAFLIGTIGGIGGLISVFINIPMRSYNRISLVIMFLSLVIAAMLAENLLKKRPKAWLAAMSAVMLCVGFYDQTVPWNTRDFSDFEAVKEITDKAEETLEPGDSIFVLPYDDWPSSKIPGGGYMLHMGYIESEGLHWSYGAAQGRPEAEWQKATAEKMPEEMVRQVREAGYDGIWMDTALMTRKNGDSEETEWMIGEITDAAGTEPITSRDGRICFWKIKEEKLP